MSRIFLFLACGAALAAGEPQNKSLKSMPSVVTYTSTVADDQFATTLSISSESAGELIIGSNRDRPAAAAGRFDAAVPRTLLQRLAPALSNPQFAASPSKTDLLSGDAFRKITFVDPRAGEISKVVGAGSRVPAPFLEAEGAIQAIIEFLKGSPTAAATVALENQAPRVRAGSTTPFDLVLRNAGRMPFRIEPPASWGKGSTVCELGALRADVPLAQLGAEHQKFAQLDGSVFVSASKQPEGGYFLLQPGEGIALRFRNEFKWPPGRYKIEIALTLSLLGSDGSPLFAGCLVSEPRMVEVAGQ